MAKTIVQALVATRLMFFTYTVGPITTSCWILSMGSWGATIGVLLSHKWKQNSVEGLHHSALDTIANMEGLFQTCQVFPSGQKQCYSLAPVSMVVLACRCFLIFAILLGCIAGLVTLMGFKCTAVGPSTAKAKAKCALISGIMFLVSASCVIIASCWYIFSVMTSPPPIGPRRNLLTYKIHEAVQICLAFGLLWFIGSIFVIVGSRHHDPTDDVTYNYNQTSRAKQEYI